ncbi:MAG TPA: GtrA family protein [Caulobacteraceae bacterium]|nr:GtrA family protein [Caulobacteraceae bacterium]
MSVARQLPWFAVFGVLASGTHFVVALAAARFLRLEPLAANTVAFAAALGVSYLGNAIVTFRVRPWDGAQFARFAALSLAGFALNQAIVYALTVRGGWPFWASLLVVIALVPPATFVLAKLWALAPARR